MKKEHSWGHSWRGSGRAHGLQTQCPNKLFTLLVDVLRSSTARKKRNRSPRPRLGHIRLQSWSERRALETAMGRKICPQTMYADSRERLQRGDCPWALPRDCHFSVCPLASLGQQLAPKPNSLAIPRISQQPTGNRGPSTERREWLSSPCEPGRISQNVAHQGAQTQQLAEFKCQFPGRHEIKAPNKVMLSANGTFPILGEACFKPSGCDAEVTPKPNLAGCLLPKDTRPTKPARSALQPATMAPAMTHLLGVFQNKTWAPYYLGQSWPTKKCLF